MKSDFFEFYKEEIVVYYIILFNNNKAHHCYNQFNWWNAIIYE